MLWTARFFAAATVSFTVPAIATDIAGSDPLFLWIGAGVSLLAAGVSAVIVLVQRKDTDTPWPDRPGAPQFRMSPGADGNRLLCEFTIAGASPAPGGVEMRWSGPAIEMGWTKPMPQNTSTPDAQGYQMKPTAMSPTPPDGEVVLKLRLNWDDGQHGGEWRWPIRQHAKGHWIVDSHLGTGVSQPVNPW